MALLLINVNKSVYFFKVSFDNSLASVCVKKKERLKMSYPNIELILFAGSAFLFATLIAV